MKKWVVFYDKDMNELAAYTKAGTFAGECKATVKLLAYERGIPEEEIIVKEIRQQNRRALR